MTNIWLHFMLLSQTILALIYIVFCDNTETTEDDSDKLWVLIENVNVMECEGPPNQFQLSRNHISVRNSKGQSVDYVEIPGKYALAFDNIQVRKSMPNLSGDLFVALQIPLVQSNLLTFDLPYQILPQKKVFFDGYTCDDESGVVSDPVDGRKSCRYCDLCDTASTAGNILGSRLKVEKEEESFDKVCRKIDADTYSLWRTISLPGRKQLEKEVTEKYRNKIGADTLQRLKSGRGKLIVKMSAYTNPAKTFTSDSYFEGTPGCECCSKRIKKMCFLNLFNIEELTRGETARCERCMNDYASQCSPGAQAAYRAACYVVEFNFRLSAKRSDLNDFLKQGDHNNQYHAPSNNYTVNEMADYGRYLKPYEQVRTTSGYDAPSASCDNLDERCLTSMSESSRLFCSRYLKSKGPAKKFCCKLCNAS